ncbi:MAG: LLM class flavin-dependent oxidoreductase [Deltaproteobacteria bacterium]|nr:LLM class flavin-dependent oxidoreductase [Deltaproteobacteria bacterium]
MDVGLLMLGHPGKAREIARRTEAAGFSHLALGDTQNLGPETWSQLMLVAGACERIRIGTGVTNTTTRDVAVTASAALALQLESGGRAFCGIGRGDSALAKIGRRPAPPDAFERDLTSLRAYLAGEATPRGPAASRIEWSRGLSIPRVPIEVAVSGPRVLEIAARHADAFIFCLGADPKTLERAMRAAREAVARAGRDPKSLRYGAFVNCVVDDDVARARAIARGGVSVFARFAGWSSGAGELGDPELRREGRSVAERYEMDRHAEAAGEGARALEDAHIDRFAIVGPVRHAAARLRELAAIGLDFVTVAPGSSDMDWEAGWRSIERIGNEVVPQVG